jgi:dipeptidyl aminopeptidase/acylaminoacyl peptidase
LTHHPGPDEEPVPSPDGSKIAYIGHDFKRQAYVPTKLYVMNADGSRGKVLGGLLDRDAAQPQWSSDSRTIYFLAEDHGSTSVYAARADGSLRRAIAGAGRLRGFSLADNGRAVSVRSTITAPSEVVTYAVDSAPGMAAIARLNNGWLAGRESGAVEEIVYPSGIERIQAWLTRPPAAAAGQKYPLLLDVPGDGCGAEFNLRAQIFASRDFLVLCANPRGSAGYGEQFGNVLPARFPGDDFDDLMRGVDFLIAGGDVDERRVFIAGGLLAAWAIGHTNRFRAAVVRRPIADWATDIATRPDGFERAALWRRAMPWENPEQYIEHSPLYSAGDFETPVLILAGDPDPESEELYFALQARKVESALARFPDTGRPSDEIAELGATLAWIARFSTQQR